MAQQQAVTKYPNIHNWLTSEVIRNEKGERIEFDNHLFLFDIYSDQSSNVTIMKAAQVGLSTAAILKNHNDAKNHKMDIIYCVDTETEALTKNGFKKYNEITLNDELLTLDLNGTSSWQQVKEVFVNIVDTEMYRYESRNFNAFVTSNHRWIVESKNNGKLSIVETSKLKKRGLYILKLATNYKDPVQIYSNDYVELLSWIFSEGYYCKQKGKDDWSIIISQSKKNKIFCEQIRSCLERNGAKWKEYFNNINQCFNFRFAFELGRKIKLNFPHKLPTAQFAKDLTRGQAKLFIDTFVSADGWIDKFGTKAISQKNKECVDIIAMIAVIAGYVPSIIPPGKNNAYTIRMTQFSRVFVEELKPEITKEKDILIWCPRTDIGTFYARRNGRCYWTGNTLPTDNDVRVFVGGKVNRIIANNKSMLTDVADKDSIEQKQVGDSMIYFRGTWTKKSAIMVTADRLVHDEKDSSKLDIIADYQARLQHSKFKQTHTFSHPSLPETGIHADWLMSDQKHWFITCPSCGFKQFLNWDEKNPKRMSIDLERKIFICTKCRNELPDYVRQNGEWIAKYPGRKWSGYWVSLLMAPWVSAADIIEKFKDPNTTPEFFYTKVLGLPYADASSKLLRDSFFQNLTGKSYAPNKDARVVIGIDTGLRLDYVIGDKYGLFFHGDCSDYGELDNLMKRWPRAMAVIDQGGDLIGSRAFAQRWPGRVFLCMLTGDKQGKELFIWGKGDEQGSVKAERNRSIQLVVDEFRTKRIPVHGTEDDWYEYWLDWNNLAKMKVLDPDTNQTKGYKWVRSGRDHKALATVFWRVGMSRFAGMGSIVVSLEPLTPNSYMVEPNQTAKFDPEEMFQSAINRSLDALEDTDDGDWRGMG